MRYYPVFADIKDKPCKVIGGGKVAERKVEGLLKAGASVTVISPRISKTLDSLAKKGSISLIKRRYREGDLTGVFLAVSASDSESVNKTVYNEALRAGILINTVDDPERCSFIVPSVVDRGSLIIAISTSGKSPALARKLREGLEKTIGGEYETFVDILGAVRKKLLKSNMNHVKKERVFKALVNSPIPGWIKEKDFRKVEGFLVELLGKGYTLSGAGIKLKGQGGVK
ncbi:MAG: bifunctional precorrin-2 dehydrogenase/sirohydrochlorin ferrochelatase [Deltaproteobacteria bacterium]|nr:bifunctional precorrin-2 dehydrogenase/sirohydrochlorin ferrochelatase [Deltaproteobacteria bacterium]